MRPLVEHIYGICRLKGILNTELKIILGEYKHYTPTVNGIALRVFVRSSQKLRHLKDDALDVIVVD